MAALIPRPNYPPYNASGAIDAGREEVDEILRDMEQRVHREYEQAAREMNDKAYEYLMDFYEADMEQAARLRRGEISDEEYRNWRISHIATGRRWFEMADSLASDMTQTNEIASGIINGYMPEIFACGFNYGLYQGEITGGFETSFTLYDRNTVMRLIAEEPDLLPLEAKINVPEDMRWNTQKIASCMAQSIMQGETIPQIAERMARTVGGMNERVAIRNARTATTSAENGGRYSGYRKLTEAGANLTIEWCATLDGRTRHEHRLLDGQRQNVDEPFEVDGMKILYAGDPRAPQGLIWNCRCTMLCWAKGFEESLMLKAQTQPDDMSYAEWKFAKQEEYERRKERTEARRNQPRVNPDNPSYGYASDFTGTIEVPATEAVPTYEFNYDVAGASKVNEHLAEMQGIEREQWERNLQNADIHVVERGSRPSEEHINGMVFLFPTSSDDTVFHEVSHAIDNGCVNVTVEITGRRMRMGEWRENEPYTMEHHSARHAASGIYDAKSDDGDGRSQWVKDMSALFDWAGIPHSDGKATMPNNEAEVLLSDKLMQFKEKHGSDAASTLSDMIDAITLGQYPILYAIHGGHGEEYWMRDGSRRWGEGWAEISALHAQHNEAALEEIRQILPETADALETVWSVVYEHKPFENTRTEETERRVSQTVFRISPADV